MLCGFFVVLHLVVFNVLCNDVWCLVVWYCICSNMMGCVVCVIHCGYLCGTLCWVLFVCVWYSVLGALCLCVVLYVSVW